MVRPTCTIIAGPNGAGKTTFALNYLPTIAGHKRFVNADSIAAGLSPLSPETELIQATRLFLNEIKTHSQRRNNFAFETTLAGRGYLRFIKRLQDEGWQVGLIYLALLDVTVSVARVAERVRYGGHDIPRDAIERRFPRSLNNLFSYYVPACNFVACHDNTNRNPTLIFEQTDGIETIHDRARYDRLLEESRR